ncbi:MAG: alpha-amylase, partial [Anaerolineae bacterium]|nr:alpha-amylase [Anaerolineae bacterium]
MAAQAWRANPLLYEINTWTWLYGLSERYQRRVTLGSVPDETLDALASWGLDAIWLMGVWERSPLSRKIAAEHPDLQAEYRRALPDFHPGDISGSPYAIRRYEVDPYLGERDELAALRERLAARNLRLILDFVPNHTSHDAPWLETHPEYYLHGT